MIKVQYRILNHTNVVGSPITNDTLLIIDKDTGKIIYLFTLKYFNISNIILVSFIEYFIELHNDIIKTELHGGIACVCNDKNFLLVILF